MRTKSDFIVSFSKFVDRNIDRFVSVNRSYTILADIAEWIYNNHTAFALQTIKDAVDMLSGEIYLSFDEDGLMISIQEYNGIFVFIVNEHDELTSVITPFDD